MSYQIVPAKIIFVRDVACQTDISGVDMYLLRIRHRFPMSHDVPEVMNDPAIKNFAAVANMCLKS